ncbi:MAG: hypothetical protein JSS74_06335 [Actinobacteria bacterium]|nr:hypothetical protein [Actinomycetota bacterium]
MTEKTRRKDLMRPLTLVGFSLLCGVFAGIVTVIATGAFTQNVIRMVDNGTYEGIPPWNLAFIVAGAIFIAALLILSLLMLAIDPRDFSHTVDRPVLLDKQAPDAAENDATGVEGTGSAETETGSDGGVGGSTSGS